MGLNHAFVCSKVPVKGKLTDAQRRGQNDKTLKLFSSKVFSDLTSIEIVFTEATKWPSSKSVQKNKCYQELGASESGKCQNF